MKNLHLAVLFLCAALTSAYGQCSFTSTLSSVTAGSAFDNRANGVNSVNGNRPCQSLTISYAVTTFTAMYLQLEGAPDSSGSPGAYVALVPISGVNPTMSITQFQTVTFNLATLPSNGNSQDWLRFNLLGFTNAGNVVCTATGTGPNPFPPTTILVSNNLWSLFSTPAGGTSTGLLILQPTALSGSNITGFRIVPRVGGGTSEVRLQNSSDTSETNAGVVWLRMSPTAFLLQSRIKGTGSGITSQRFGEDNTAAVLTSWGIQFNGVDTFVVGPGGCTTGCGGGVPITGTGLVRQNSVATELSADCVTSGSNAVTCKPGVTIATSGPVADPGGSAAFLENNASGAMTFTLAAGVAGLQRCYRNSTGKTGVITVAVITSNQIDLAGVNGTVTSGTLVSGGGLGDQACLYSDASGHWMAQIVKGSWVNN